MYKPMPWQDCKDNRFVSKSTSCHSYIQGHSPDTTDHKIRGSGKIYSFPFQKELDEIRSNRHHLFIDPDTGTSRSFIWFCDLSCAASIRFVNAGVLPRYVRSIFNFSSRGRQPFCTASFRIFPWNRTGCSSWLDRCLLDLRLRFGDARSGCYSGKTLLSISMCGSSGFCVSASGLVWFHVSMWDTR